jgi:predicted Holliday junction resolvase-like endonuclease
MAYIHKNVNSGLLMLITFLSVALVTATVYSVQAFDSVTLALAEKEAAAAELTAQLREHEAMNDALKQTAQLTKDREAALANILEQQRQETAQQDSTGSTATIAVSTESASAATYPRTGVYNPYRQKYFGWAPQKRYVY